MYLIGTNLIYYNHQNDAGTYDFQIPVASKGIILFIHGYKGFKDWGAWNLVQSYFVNQNFGFVKFNMTHNGIGQENLLEFTELQKFSDNTYSLEVSDTLKLIELVSKLIQENFKNKLPIYLLGHSRGGGVAILSFNERISKVATLASISDIESRFPKNEKLKKWIEEGIHYVLNSRTNQEMPHSTNIYFDYLSNKSNLNIHESAKKLGKKLLIIHGDKDDTVSIKEAFQLASWSNTDVSIVENANHTFGANHPWNDEELPIELKKACDLVLDFFNKPTS